VGEVSHDETLDMRELGYPTFLVYDECVPPLVTLNDVPSMVSAISVTG